VSNLLRNGKACSPALVAEFGNGTQDHRVWDATTCPSEFQSPLVFLDLTKSIFYSAS